MQNTSDRAKANIPTLDGWRAVAVMLVIGAHSAAMLINTQTRIGTNLAEFLSHAGYGVDIFFTLSGYLICTLLLEEKARSGTIGLGRFYTRRAFRILPPVLVYLFTLLILVQVGRLPSISIEEFLSTLFFARNYFVAGAWYTGHFWSLAVEEHFYLVAPIFFLLLQWKKAWQVALMLITLCVVIRYLEFSQLIHVAGVLEFRTENRLDGLLWGSILALLLQKPTIRASMARHLTMPVAAVVLIASIVLVEIFPAQPARRTIVAFALPFLISHTVLHPTGMIGRVLEVPLLRWIGRLSYSLYIWQMLFLPNVGRPLGGLQSFPLALVSPLVCAMISYYFVEKPMIHIGHRLAGSQKEISIAAMGRLPGLQVKQSRNSAGSPDSSA